MFGPSYSKSKFKALTKAACARIRIRNNKSTEVVKNEKRGVVELMKEGHYGKASIRIEGIISKEQHIEANSILDLLCDMLHARSDYIASSKTCPDDMLRAVHTVIWCVGKIDIDEIPQIAKQLTARWGKEFARRARGNEDGAVDPRILALLSTTPPEAHAKVQHLQILAEDNGIEFDSDHRELPSIGMAPVATHGAGPPPSNGSAGGGGGGGYAYPAAPQAPTLVVQQPGYGGPSTGSIGGSSVTSDLPPPPGHMPQGGGGGSGPAAAVVPGGTTSGTYVTDVTQVPTATVVSIGGAPVGGSGNVPMKPGVAASVFPGAAPIPGTSAAAAPAPAPTGGFDMPAAPTGPPAPLSGLDMPAAPGAPPPYADSGSTDALAARLAALQGPTRRDHHDGPSFPDPGPSSTSV